MFSVAGWSFAILSLISYYAIVDNVPQISIEIFFAFLLAWQKLFVYYQVFVLAPL